MTRIICLLLALTAAPTPRFIGVNCFDLARYSDRADEIFTHLSTNGVRVVRFWAFQKYCGPTGQDFHRFDQLIAASRRHGIQLLPVLENHWQHCTYSTDYLWKPPAWYATGWRRERFAGAPLTYREYVGAIAAHYRHERQIMAWQLMNEAEIYPDTRESFVALRQFAVEVSRELKTIDPEHPVSFGLLGIGQPGTMGKKYRRLHDLPGIDWVTAHDHGYMNEPLAGKDWPKRENSFFADLHDARALGKPFVATEAGIALEWVHGDLLRRTELFRQKLRAFFSAGGTGYILWNYEPEPDTNYGFGPEDPILPMLKQTTAVLEN